MAKDSRRARVFQWSALLFLLVIAAPGHSAAGRTAGSFDVSPAGSAAYAIPIFTPPGPNGIQPGIALAYSSNGGVGYVGRGWSLSGLSAITRCNKTVAQDGAAKPVELVVGDGYCLNGNRLRRTGGAAYGTAGSVYQTEIADFSEITAVGTAGNGPSYFTVRSKDGLILTFGGTPDSRVLATGTSTAHIWMLSEIRDRSTSQNKVVFTYKTPDGVSTFGTTHPTKIQWTQTSAGSGTYLYSMDFTYGSNLPATSYYGFVWGSEIRDTDILTGISIKELGVVKRHYILGYETSPTTSGKRLNSFVECKDDVPTDCYIASSFTYQNGTVGSNLSALTVNESGPVTGVTGRHDFNGDGILDLAYRSGGTWYVRFGSTGGYSGPVTTTITATTVTAGSLFANGKHQLLAPVSNTWYVYSWNGSSFTGSSTGITVAASAAAVHLADVDADGKSDLVYANIGTGYNITMTTRPNTSVGTTLSFGTPVNSTVTLTSFPGSFPPGSSATLSGAQVFADSSLPASLKGRLDMNGDQREDLAVAVSFNVCTPAPFPPGYFCGTGWGVYTVTSINTYQYTFSPAYPGSVGAMGLLANINEDSCTDLAFASSVYLSGCNGTTPTSISTTGTNLGTADWDGDGRDDLLLVPSGSSTIWVRLSTGSGLGTAQNTGISSTCANLVVTDSNGDGLDEIGCWNNSSNLKLYAHNGSTITPDLAVVLRDGWGVEFKPEYGEISQSNYAAGSGATYPLQDMASGMLIVKKVVATDGAGGTFDTVYNYFGAVLNSQGLGFQGFERIESEDSRNLTKRKQYFDRTYPNSGALSDDKLFQQDGTPMYRRIIGRSVQTLDPTPNNQRYFVYTYIVSEDWNEVGGPKNGQYVRNRTKEWTLHPTSGYGNFGTVKVTDTALEGPYSGRQWISKDDFAFSPDAANWCIGIPTAVTHTDQAFGEPNVVRASTVVPNYVNCRVDSVSTGGGNRQIDTAHVYDSFGNLWKTTTTGRESSGVSMTPRVREVQWGSADGTIGGTGQFPVSDKNELLQETKREFHSTYGLLTKETDPNGIFVERNIYDDFGRLDRATRADDTYVKNIYYDCTGWCISGDPATYSGTDRVFVHAAEYDSSNAHIRDSYTHFDLFNRPLVSFEQTMSGGYSRTGRIYDNLGRVSQESMPCDFSSCVAYWVTNTYDLADRLTKRSRWRSQASSTPVENIIAYLGATQMVTDGEGKNSVKIFDASGLLRHSEDHNGYYQDFEYDAAGNVRLVTDTTGTQLFTATYSYGGNAIQDSVSDKDLGARTYYHNSLGELTLATDANGNSAAFEYDALSRIKKRVEPEDTTEWTWGSVAANHNIGRLESVAMLTSGYAEVYNYDGIGRAVQRNIYAGSAYAFDYAYTNQGRLDSVTYPTSTYSTRLKVKYGYQYGTLSSVTDWTSGSAGTVFWTATSRNFRGQTDTESLGGGAISTTRSFDAVTGWLTGVVSNSSSGTIQNESYLYDRVGNVQMRQEGTLGLMESFCYDNLHRLTDAKLGNPNCTPTPTLNVSYDTSGLGNIKARSDVNSGATWSYDPVRKHAVTNTGGALNYGYDNNGNMKDWGATNNIAWSSYNLPLSISSGSDTAAFSYGPERQYYKQIYTKASGTETTQYVGDLLEVINSGADWRHYVVADGQTVAIVSRKPSGDSVAYPLEDSLGSPSVLVNSSGSPLVRESFDAFGAPRNGSTWSGAVPPTDQSTIENISRRGYTGHTMIGAMDLIHMNGRVQDPKLGRFLSPDPNVFEPNNTQGFNRFAYVDNNPMKFVDPSGFGLVCVPSFFRSGIEGTVTILPIEGDVIDPRYPGPITGSRHVTRNHVACNWVYVPDATTVAGTTGVSAGRGWIPGGCPNLEVLPNGLTPQVSAAANGLAFLLYMDFQFAGSGERMGFGETTRDLLQQGDRYAVGRRGIAGERTITNAKPGESYHHYNVAFDIKLFTGDGRYREAVPGPYLKDDTAAYRNAGILGEQLGLEWGGRFKGKNYDPSHFQISDGLSWDQVRANHSAGRDPLCGGTPK